MTTPPPVQTLRFLKRKDTPAWLMTFAFALYGRACIICGKTRLLEVAHLSNWATVKGEMDSANELLQHQAFGPDAAHALFHQPVNVVILCRECHGLFDTGDPDVTIEKVIAARDNVLATERAASVVLDYFCRGWIGAIGAHHGNTIDRWFPMLDYLKVAWRKGLLPDRPRQFLLTPVEMVDLAEAAMIVRKDLDQGLPRWTRRGFMIPHID